VKPTTLNTSIVVIADGYDPFELYACSLPGQGIVPPEWKLVEQPISTPVLSVLKFANGTVITLEPNKLMVMREMPDPATSISGIVTALLERSTRSQLSAVGLNMSAFVDEKNPGQWITERFLKQGSQNQESLKPTALGVKLVYRSETGAVHLNCEAAIRKAEGVDTSGVLLNFNHHTPISGPDTVAQAKAAIASFGKQLANFNEIGESILRQEI